MNLKKIFALLLALATIGLCSKAQTPSIARKWHCEYGYLNQLTEPDTAAYAANHQEPRHVNEIRYHQSGRWVFRDDGTGIFEIPGKGRYKISYYERGNGYAFETVGGCKIRGTAEPDTSGYLRVEYGRFTILCGDSRYWIIDGRAVLRPLEDSSHFTEQLSSNMHSGDSLLFVAKRLNKILIDSLNLGGHRIAQLIAQNYQNSFKRGLDSLENTMLIYSDHWASDSTYDQPFLGLNGFDTKLNQRVHARVFLIEKDGLFFIKSTPNNPIQVFVAYDSACPDCSIELYRDGSPTKRYEDQKTGKNCVGMHQMVE